jgi:hypothetical protein
VNGSADAATPAVAASSTKANIDAGSLVKRFRSGSLPEKLDADSRFGTVDDVGSIDPRFLSSN